MHKHIDKNEALDFAQQTFFQNQKQILQCEKLSEENYKKSLELSSRTLTEYILYREKIIQRMKEMTEENTEKEIHNLIVPQSKEYAGQDMSNDIYQNNAWLLDDKYMTFQTILSEKRMDAAINAMRLNGEPIKESGRPDITMIFSADPEIAKAVDVVVVEIKKKTDNIKENFYAISQLLNRAEKLVLHCRNIERIWYYAVMQVSQETANRLEQMKWTPLFSKSRVYYQEYETKHPDGRIVLTPTFIVSFDAIIADAAARNHTFLKILRSSMKKHIEIKDSTEVH